ncbi:MAG: hypothetical protein IJA15_05460, partial [Clostridia bacterium]|nr:hypothetical protein [Clostridia bacterium]
QTYKQRSVVFLHGFLDYQPCAGLAKYVDTIIIIPNDKLLEALPVDTPMVEALTFADDNLRQGVCGIADLISTPALINLDFADVRTIIANQGLAHMGVGRAKGENRIVEAVRQAVSSPLLETTIEGASGVIINITGGRDLTLGQVYEAAKVVQNIVDDSANIIFGANINDDIKEEVIITLIATGFSKKEKAQENMENKPARPVIVQTQPVNQEVIQRAERTLAGDNRVNHRAELPKAEPEQPQRVAPSIQRHAIQPEQPKRQEFVRPKEPEIDNSQNSSSSDDRNELPSFIRRMFGKK